MKEIWKDIPGYIGLYQVSNCGQVKSLNYNRTSIEKLLKHGYNKDGYLHVSLSKNGKYKTITIHKLVAMAFLGHVQDGCKTVVNHIDNNPINNHIDNLELVSVRYNSSCHKNDPGIYWGKYVQKWKAEIWINKKVFLGGFTNKQDALDMYQKALNNQHLYNGDNKAFRLALADIAL
jgi:hypothetical protein